MTSVITEGDSFINRRIVLPFVGALFRDLYADLAEMEDEIRRSATDWTVVRPPKLVNKPLTGTNDLLAQAGLMRRRDRARRDVTLCSVSPTPPPRQGRHDETADLISQR